jgi:hypothetical protein
MEENFTSENYSYVISRHFANTQNEKHFTVFFFNTYTINSKTGIFDRSSQTDFSYWPINFKKLN